MMASVDGVGMLVSRNLLISAWVVFPCPDVDII